MIPDLSSSDTALRRDSEYLKITDQGRQRENPSNGILVDSLWPSPVQFKCFSRIFPAGQARPDQEIKNSVKFVSDCSRLAELYRIIYCQHCQHCQHGRAGMRENCCWYGQHEHPWPRTHNWSSSQEMMLPGQWDRGTQAHTITITTIGDWIAGNGFYIHRVVWSDERERERYWCWCWWWWGGG